MSDLQNQTVGEFVKNMHTLFWIIGGVGSAFIGLASASFAIIVKQYRLLRKQDKRISIIETDQSNIHERDIGRSWFTQTVYGLSERTSTLVAGYENFRQWKEMMEDRCERRRDAKPFDGENRRKNNAS